jgi:hypothetical protein
MVKQANARRHVHAHDRGPVAQQVEAGLAVREHRADDGQRLAPHVGRRVRVALGQQLERVALAQIVAIDLHRAIAMADKVDIERRPMRSDLAVIVMQRLFHRHADAVDMDVQLVLAAAIGRVDRQADIVARDRLAGLFRHQVPSCPGGLEIVGRVRCQNLLVFDPGHDSGRDQQELGLAVAVLDQGGTAGHVDRCAGRRILPRLEMRDALVDDYLLQRIRIGLGLRGADGEADRQQVE